jgi:hypothetical protein
MIPARIRSAATMLGLLLLLLIGVAWAWSAVSEPFPEKEDVATCRSMSVEEGQKVYPDQVTVSVLNAGDREGLANRTMADLVEAGFARGKLGNAPQDADVTRVQIWTDDPENPAVRLVRSYLAKKVPVVRRTPPLPGVNVVVGDDFSGVTGGREAVAAREDATICSPLTDEEPPPV